MKKKHNRQQKKIKKLTCFCVKKRNIAEKSIKIKKIKSKKQVGTLIAVYYA